MQRPQNLQILKVTDTDGWVTNLDVVQQSANYIRDSRGFEFRTPGLLGQRINGTVHRFETYPTTNAASPAVSIKADYPLYDPKTATDHDVVVATNAASKTEFFVDSSSNNAGTWQRLTRVVKAVIATSGVVTNKIKIATGVFTEDGQALAAPTSGMFAYWIVVNKKSGVARNGQSILVTSTAVVSGNLELSLAADPATLGWTAADDVWLFYSAGMASLLVDSLDYGTEFFTNYNPIEALRKVNIHIGKNSSGAVTGQTPWRVQYHDDRNRFFALNATSVAGAITAATNTAPIQITTTNPHQCVTGDTVLIAAGTGNTAMNGQWVVTVLDSYTLTLNNSSGNGVYGASGTLQRYAQTETLPAGWYLDIPLLCKKFITLGGPEAADNLKPASGPGIAFLSDYDDNRQWGHVVLTVADSAGTVYRDDSPIACLYGYIVPIYDGTQRGDPLVQFFTTSSGGTLYPILTMEIFINSALMNPLITGFEVYMVNITQAEYTAGLHQPADSDYKLAKVVSLTSPNVPWTPNAGNITISHVAASDTNISVLFNLDVVVGYWDQYSIKFPGSFSRFDQSFSFAVAAPQSGASIVDMCGHAVLKSRDYVYPRFAVRSRRAQGASNAIDVDDRTIAVSAYSGNGVHMDDVYPNLQSDNQGFTQRFYLNSRGPILGLGIDDNKVVVYKPSEMEIVNLDTGEQNLVTIDCASRTGILHTHHGEVWAGQRGIYVMQRATSTFQLLVPWEVANDQWLNQYDGTLKTPDGTQFITDAYRSAIVAGYDPHYDVVWFQVQTNITSSTSEYLCYCYSFVTKKWWIDKRNLPTPIVCFAPKTDKTLTICHAMGILQYPNKTGSLRFEDDVKLVGGVQTTNGRGRETFLHFVFGSTYGLHDNITAWDVLLDTIGASVNGSGVYSVEMYANDDTTPFATLTVPIDGRTLPQGLPPWGEMERLSMVVRLPNASLTNFLEWDIRTIEQGVVPHKRIGTR